jgi:hypothetical protein
MHGRSMSQSLPFGVRRKTRYGYLAPRSLRRKGKHYLGECTNEELKKAGVLVDSGLFNAYGEPNERSI